MSYSPSNNCRGGLIVDRGGVNNWVRYVVWVDVNEFENEGVDISTIFLNLKGGVSSWAWGGEKVGGTFELLNVRLPIDVKLSVTVKFKTNLKQK